MAENKQKRWFHFYLCPECLKLLKHWHEREEELMSSVYEVFVDNFNTKRISEDVLDSDFIDSICPECQATFGLDAAAYEIRISQNLEIDPVGSYWTNNEEVLKKERNKIINQFLRWRDKHERK